MEGEARHGVPPVCTLTLTLPCLRGRGLAGLHAILILRVIAGLQQRLKGDTVLGSLAMTRRKTEREE
jgi:hypothetical protein